MKNLPLITKLFFSALIISTTLVAIQNKGFIGRLDDYIQKQKNKSEVKIKPSTTKDDKLNKTQKEKKGLFSFTPDDWSKFNYFTFKDGQLKKGTVIYQNDNVSFHSFGSMSMDLKYGLSVYTNDKYRYFDEDKAASKVIVDGFVPQQLLKVHMQGKIGNKLSVYIDHDSRKKDNKYFIQYKATKKNELIQEVNAGQIDIKFKNSKFAVFDNNTSKGLGADMTLKKGKFQLKAFASVSMGRTEVETFKGNSSQKRVELKEYQYIPRKYYQLEPYTRYGTEINTTDSSDPTFVPQEVSINSTDFELYMDDQVPSNNQNTVQLVFDNGYYNKLQNGVDYTINYTTGLITFTKQVLKEARIFAVYTLQSGSTTDIPPITNAGTISNSTQFQSRYFVFIKYGYSIDETSSGDINNDTKVSKDIYEVRSFYNLGSTNIVQENFSLRFFGDSNIMAKLDIETFGSYAVDYKNGILHFKLREPFKAGDLLIGLTTKIYNEKQADDLYRNSHYLMTVDFYRSARSFKLKQMNIIEKSVRLKVNGRVLPENLYSVDSLSGLVFFTDPNNPVIGPGTAIEIKYEYLPYASETQNFMGGLRGDYFFNKSFSMGASLLFLRSSGGSIIPDISNTPGQTIIGEADAKLHLNPKRMTKAVNNVFNTEFKKVPVDLKLYGEYSFSIRNVNSFGKALIDNMESSEEIVKISLSEKDWILSSMPSGHTNRGRLYYYFFRSLSDPLVLQLETYGATGIDYLVKPGPFNVAAGHYSETIQTQSTQKSLVLDYNFTAGQTCIPIVTRRLSNGVVDFSGLQYIEIWYKTSGTIGSNPRLTFDIGTINEDSDGDLSLDTEDSNNNGVIDRDPDLGISEDIGYDFGGSTKVGGGPLLNDFTIGDGVLNSEDLNGNGVLDSTDNIFSEDGFVLSVSTTWKKITVPIDRTALTASDIDILSKVQSIRMYLNNETGGIASGRIFIDSIKFVSSRWKNNQADGNVKLTILNSNNDSTYAAESLIATQNATYRSLYGQPKTTDTIAESESTLQMDYTIRAAGDIEVLRKFAKTMDLRHYKTLNLWLNYREYTTAHTVLVQIGSSEDDYYEYSIPMATQLIWHQITLKLKDGSTGNFSLNRTEGAPDMKRISMIKIVVQGTPSETGIMWINDIYVSEPDTINSHGHWIEGEIKVKKPLFKTKGGVPVLSDISIRYIKKGHGADFSSIGKKPDDISEDKHELYSYVKILPNLVTKLDFISDKSETDSKNLNVADDKRGKVLNNSFYFETDYKSNIDAVPSVKVIYKNDFYSGDSQEIISTNTVNRSITRIVHNPDIIINENIKKFLWGKFNAKLHMNFQFREEEIERTSTVSAATLADLVSIFEKEKRQKSYTSLSMFYKNDYFYIKPLFTVSTEDIVNFQGKSHLSESGIISNFTNDYHFPFWYDNNQRLVERLQKSSFEIVLHKYEFMPQYKVELNYIENNFKDYLDTDPLKSDNLFRSKDAASFISTQISLPLNIRKITKDKKWKFFKSFNFTFKRSMYLTESNVPFEGEGTNFYEEAYGISRSMIKMMNPAMNIFYYFPGAFLIGRNNCSNGRDTLNGFLNSKIVTPSGNTALDYENQIKLIDTFSLFSAFDFKKVNFSIKGSVNQVNERFEVLAIPQQVVSNTAGFNINIDLMKIVKAKSGFFKIQKNGSKKKRSAFIQLAYDFSNNNIITKNLMENIHKPKLGYTMKWGRNHIGLNLAMVFSHKVFSEYIPISSSTRNPLDDIYFNNMTINTDFSEFQMGYELSLIYETELLSLYKFIAKYYKLTAKPILSLSYSMKLNRYDYAITTSPEPYDQHLLTGKLIMNLHKNFQGGLTTKLAIEQYRNRTTENLTKEIFSFEIGFNLSLLF